MSSPVSPSPQKMAASYRFGQFELRTGAGELARNGQAQRLPDQPLQILLALLERPGEIVSRETLRDRLWPQNTFVDFELGLNAAMKRLRRALLDDAANPRFIETLPKRGYRFLAPVAVEREAADVDQIPAPAPDPEPPQALPASNGVSIRWTLWVPVALAVAVAVGLLAWNPFRATNRVRPLRRYSVVLPENAPLAPASFMPLGVGRPNLAISRDGEKIVYAAVTGKTTQLFVRDHSGSLPRALPGTEDANSPFLSPNGQWIGFFAENKLKKIRSDGGPAIALCDVPLGFGGFWSDDDTIYFQPNEMSAIYRIAASGGVPARISFVPTKATFAGLYWPELLPSGKAILFANSRSGIGVFRLRDFAATMITPSGSSPRWSSTGHILYVDNGNLWALPFDANRLQQTGPAAVLVEHVRMDLQGAAQFDISQEGTLVYAPGGDVAEASLTWVNPSGEASDAGLPPKRYGEFQLSPDGKTLAVVIYNGALRDLWSLDLERNVLTRLTDEGRLWSPFWSPDGKRIVYAASSSGAPHLIELTMDGLGKREIISLPTLGAFNGFTPEGRILFTTRDGTETVVSAMAIDTGERREVFRSPYMIAFQTLSPDGRWLAYVSDETGRWEVYVRAMSGDSPTARITTDGGEEPVWDRSGRRIYFRNGARWMRVDVSTRPGLKAAEPVEVFGGPFVNIPGYSYNVAADGRFLLLKSEYQSKTSTQLEIVENWPALLR